MSGSSTFVCIFQPVFHRVVYIHCTFTSIFFRFSFWCSTQVKSSKVKSSIQVKILFVIISLFSIFSIVFLSITIINIKLKKIVAFNKKRFMYLNYIYTTNLFLTLIRSKIKVVRLEKSYFHLQTITSHYIVIISLVYNKILI